MKKKSKLLRYLIYGIINTIGIVIGVYGLYTSILQIIGWFCYTWLLLSKSKLNIILSFYILAHKKPVVSYIQIWFISPAPIQNYPMYLQAYIFTSSFETFLKLKHWNFFDN